MENFTMDLQTHFLAHWVFFKYQKFGMILACFNSFFHHVNKWFFPKKELTVMLSCCCW